MPGDIRQFEDLEAWKQARDLSCVVIGITRRVEFARVRSLRDQMQRASISVVSNIAEGFERGGDREFRQFLAIAKGSVGELRAQLYIAADAGLIGNSEFDGLMNGCLNVSRLIAGLMRSIVASGYRGTRFR